MKRIFVLLLCLSLLFPLVFGAAVSAASPVTIRVGVYENRPKIFTDDKGNASGFWPDIIEYIASEEGWGIEYVHGSWEQCLSRLEKNEIDIMPDVAYTEDRSRLYSFSNEAVYTSWSRAYTRKGIDIQSILDLSGKTIAVLKGSVNVEGPDGIKKLVSAFNIDCNFTEVDSYTRVFELVESGEADAGVASKDFGYLYEADFNVVRTAIIFQPASLYFAFSKGSSLTPYLIGRVDYHVRQLRENESSVYYQSLEKWLGIKPAEESVIPGWLIWVLVGIGGLALLLAGGGLILRSQVKARTRELRDEIAGRRQADETLAISEAKYRDLVEKMNEGIYKADPAGNCTYMNDAGARILGFDSAAGNIGKYNVKEFWVDLKDREKFIAELRSKGTCSQEVRSRKKDGTIIWLLLNVNANLDNEGKLIAYEGVFADITERKLAEEELTASETRYRRLFEAAKDGILIVNAETGLIIDVNPFLVELLGFSKDEFIGKELWEIGVFHDIMANKVNFEELLQKGHIRYENLPLRTAGGRQVDVEFVSNIYEVDHQKVIQCNIRDITERKLAEEELRMSEEKFMKAFQLNPDPMSITTLADGRYLDVNESFLTLYDYPREKVVGRTSTELNFWDDMQQRDRFIEALKARGTLTNFEYSFTLRSGVRHTTLLSAEVIELNGVTCVLSNIKDISERIFFQEQIAHLASFPELNPNPVFEIDLSGSITYTNPAARLIFPDLLEKASSHPAISGWQSLVEELKENVQTHTIRELKLNGSYYLETVHLVREQGLIRFYTRDITKRKNAEERARHLNEILGVLRGVNQLITREKDREQLIQKSCELMVEARGFYCSWILLFDEQKNYVTAAISNDEDMQDFRRQLAQGSYPPCIDRILAYKDSLALCSDIVEKGLDCLPGSYRDGQGLISRLEYEGKVYGVVSVYVAPDYIFDPEEQALFRELAGDIAYALSSIEKEEERKRMEEAYRVLFESSAEGILIADVETKRLKYANPAICRLLGYSEPELKQMMVTDIHPKDALEYVLPDFEAQARGEKTLNTAVPCLRKDGTIIYADINTASALIDGRACNIGFFTDVTERRQAEQRLRESEQKYRSLFENMHTGFAYCRMIFDDNNQPVDFVYLEVNDSFEALTGLKKEAVLDKKVTEAIPGIREANPELFSIYGKVAQTGEPAEFEIYIQPLKIWLEISVYSPQKGYFVAIFENITERKKMQAHLMVNDRLASIGELASGIAHEINNPLTGILGLSELILDANIPDDVREDLKTIHGEAQRTARIVQNLLTFARKHPLEKQATNVNNTINTVLELRAYEQKVNNINVVTNFTPDLPEIKANASQLQQVFINIIINAEFFMTRVHGRGTLTINTEQVADVVRISFADDGPGMTKETLSHLFIPFFTTKETGKGTGLGLSICHGIVTEHGGRIYAESEAGKGATFIIELPVNFSESEEGGNGDEKQRRKKNSGN